MKNEFLNSAAPEQSEPDTYDNMIWPLLAVAMFPQAVVTGSIHVSLSDVYLVLGLLLLLLVRGRNIRGLPWYYAAPSVSFLLWCLVSSVAGPSAADTQTMIQYVEYLLIAPLLFYNIESEATILRAFKLVAVVGGILGAIALYSGFQQGFDSPVFIFGLQKNALGGILAYTLPIVACLGSRSGRKSRGAYYLVALALCAGIFSSMSRGAMLGALAGILAFILATRRFFPVLLRILIIASGLLLTWWILPEKIVSNLTNLSEGSSAYTRIIERQDAFSWIDESSFYGYGVGNYHISIPSIGFSQNDPNNVFLLILIETGVVGLCLFVLVVFSVLLSGIRSIVSARRNGFTPLIDAAFLGMFVARLVHIQVDVSWVRGASTFMFLSAGGLMLCKSARATHQRGAALRPISEGSVFRRNEVSDA